LARHNLHPWKTALFAVHGLHIRKEHFADDNNIIIADRFFSLKLFLQIIFCRQITSFWLMSSSNARFMCAISASMRTFRSSNIALRLGYVDELSAHQTMNCRMSLLSIPTYFKHEMTRSASISRSLNLQIPDARSMFGKSPVPRSIRSTGLSSVVDF